MKNYGFVECISEETPEASVGNSDAKKLIGMK